LRRIVLGIGLQSYVTEIAGLIGSTIAARSMQDLGRPPDLRDGKQDAQQQPKDEDGEEQADRYHNTL